MEEQTVGLFVQRRNVPVPLRGVAVEIELSGMIAHTLVTQRYRNESKEVIEAIYVFPLPVEGVLLDMEIVIAGKRLKGIVQSNSQARSAYENAVTSGNGAFLLRQLREGFFQMNVGNLKPGEEAEIRIGYAQILRWSGNTLRYRLPTVIAPHYGDPREAGIAREDAPQTALQAEYPLRLEMQVKGELARAEMACPTHAVVIERGQSATLVRLGEKAFLDRDFVLTLEMSERPVWEVLVAPDGEGYAALGCLNVPVPESHSASSRRDLTVLVDCSGSMNGDSIAQARSALLAIIDELQDGDSIAVMRFGSITATWTPGPVTIDAAQRKKLHQQVSTLEADMGGTEIMHGIWNAISISKPGADILLITDGEAYVSETELLRAASKSHRFFTVGVGAAVSEEIVRKLADASGGACELVTPNEQMAKRIVAHARRMSMPRAMLEVDWHAGKPLWQHQRGVVFAGDTLPIMASLAAAPSKSPSVSLQANERSTRYEAEARLCDGALAKALPRIVAWHRLGSLKSEEEAADIAVRYQLVTPHTSMVAVLERAEGEKTDGLPALADVPQMLAAGWGGAGSVRYGAFDTTQFCISVMDDSDFSIDDSSLEMPAPILKEADFSSAGKSSTAEDLEQDLYDIDAAELERSMLTPLLEAIQAHCLDESTGRLILSRDEPGCLMDMLPARLPQKIKTWLEGVVLDWQAKGIGEAEKAVILAFLACLLDLIDAEEQKRYRALRRAVAAEIRSDALPGKLLDDVKGMLSVRLFAHH